MTLASLRWFTSSTQDFPFKRHKVPRACQQCRRKKIRCDGKKPCGRCVQQSLECSYAEQQPRTATTGTRRQSSDPVSKNATSSSPPCRQPLSPSPSPSPKQQQQQQHRLHFVRERLDRISFSDDLYNAMSMQYNNDSIIHRSQLFNNNKCLPPLMYDFFHFTSQPHTIWSSFIRRFKHYQSTSQSQQQETTSAIRDLLEEALTIFERHHLLYSSLFDIENLRNNTLCPQFLSHMSNVPNTKDAITLFSIFALVFRAAFQSLAIILPNDMATTLEHCAAVLAQEAQHRFLRITFFETATSKDNTETLFGLVAVAVLLTHYLCTALCQENAYMVLHLGVAYASRCSLGARIKAFDSTHGRKNKRKNNTKRITEDRWRKMYIVLNAWQIWMSFYLHRDINNNGSSLAEIARDCSSLSSEKDWALHAVVGYVDFLQRITNTEMGCMDIKYEMDQLAQKTGICNIKETNLPGSTLSLFHHVLSIQLFSCQQQYEPCKTSSNDSDERMILDMCGSSAAKIVDIIDGLTMEYHAPMTKSSKQHDPISTAVLYPLCLATSTISTLYSLHHHHPHTISNKRGSSQKSAIPDTNLPIFKLRRLLNPICSQVSAASVISSTLDEIQAAVRRSSTSCSRSSSSSSGTLTTTTTTTLSQQEEQQLHPSSSSTEEEEEMTWQLDSTSLEQQQDASDNGRTATLAEDEEDILLPDDLFRTSTTRYMYPARNEVDRQQLDKLFHNKDLRSNSAIATYHHQHHHGNGATPGVDFGGITTAAPAPVLSSSERGQKRRFASSTMPVKRTRGSMDALSCYGNEAASHTTMPNNPNTFAVPDQLAEESFVEFPSYTDDGGFLLMDIQANAIAAAAATVTNFNSERGDHTDNPPSSSTTTTTATTTRPTSSGGGIAPPLPPPSSSSTSSSEPFITGIREDNDDGIPRQLPPPPKHQQQMPKNWSAISHQQQQRNRDEPFQASVLETLHPNTLGSTSTTATMGMYPMVQSNQHHQLYSSTTAPTAAQQQQQQHGGTAETEGDDHNMVPYFFNMGNPLAQPTTTPNAWMATTTTTTRSKMPTSSSSQPSSSHPSWRNQQNPSFAAGVRQHHHHQRGILNHQGHPTAAAAQWLQMPPTAAAAAAAVAAAATDKMLPVTANDMLATWPNG